MDAYEAILTKRDTRDYEDRAIPDDVLRRIIQAGRMAGSSRNEQPIRVIIVRDLEQKTALAACGRGTAHLITCPIVIVIVRAEGSRPFDAGRAGQNMMIAAQSEGITSCPVGIQQDEPAREVLGLPPDQIVAMALTMGYPTGGRAEGRGERRLSIDSYAHWERWGQMEP
jgi:nitroreductase